MAIFKTVNEVLLTHSLNLKQGHEADGSSSVSWVDITNVFAPGLYRKLRQWLYILPFLILPVAFGVGVLFNDARIGWLAFFGMIGLTISVAALALAAQKDARLTEYPRHLIFRPDGRLEATTPFQWVTPGKTPGIGALPDLGSWKDVVSVEFGDANNPDTPPPPDHGKRFALALGGVHCVVMFYADGSRRTVSESYAGRDAARMVTAALTNALANARRGSP